MKNLNVLGDSPEIEYAEEMVLDESGFDLLIDDNIIISGSFENLNPFELAYRVLPEDFEMPNWCQEEWSQIEAGLADITDEDLEAEVWIGLQELAKRGGYTK